MLIDRIAYQSRWRQRHPGEKLLLCGGLLVLTLALPPLTTAPLVLALTTAAAILPAGVPAGAMVGALLMPAGFLLAGTPMLALSVDVSDGFSVTIGPDGMRLAAEVGLRSLAAVSCLTLLALTTPLVDLLPLLRRLRVPAAVIEIGLLTYRLIFVLADKLVSGQRAQAARLGYADARRSLRSAGLLSAALLGRSIDQARRLEIGLAGRGFESALPVLAPPRRWSAAGLCAVVAALAAVAGASLTLQTLAWPH